MDPPNRAGNTHCPTTPTHSFQRTTLAAQHSQRTSNKSATVRYMATPIQENDEPAAEETFFV